jgi:ABC transporter substrate binding protein
MSPMLYDGGSRNSEGTSARSGVRPTSCSTRQNLLPGPALPAPYARLRRTTLLSALAAHGFVDGQNLVVVQRSADGRIARLDGLAAELKAANVDVIVTFGYPAALAAKKSAKDVPIVGTGAGDPVATGLVDRLRGWPIATIAFYGPNLSQATKVTVGIVPSENAEVKELRDWKVEHGDVRADPGIAREILEFIENRQVLSVAMTDSIIGCPHQEGIDYEGEWCPACEFWHGRDRFTGQTVH